MRSRILGLGCECGYAIGLVVVTNSHVNCQAYLVIDGQTGFVFFTGDEESLSKALQRLLEDRAQAARMGQNGQQHIQTYSTQASVQGLLEAMGLRDARFE